MPLSLFELPPQSEVLQSDTAQLLPKQQAHPTKYSRDFFTRQYNILYQSITIIRNDLPNTYSVLASMSGALNATITKHNSNDDIFTQINQMIVDLQQRVAVLESWQSQVDNILQNNGQLLSTHQATLNDHEQRLSALENI